MLARKRQSRKVTRIHRRTLRTIPSRTLEEAYTQLLDGYGEGFACITLGIDRSLLEGALRPALEEALWERGCFRWGLSAEVRRGGIASWSAQRRRQTRVGREAR